MRRKIKKIYCREQYSIKKGAIVCIMPDGKEFCAARKYLYRIL